MKRKLQHKNIYLLILSVIIIFILYGKSLKNSYNIDDNYVVRNHEHVEKGIKGIPDIFTSRYNSKEGQNFGYRPLTIALFAIEYQIFGENTSVFHLFNILWYIILLISLYLLIRKLIPDINEWFVIIFLLIFAVHPIHTEVVLSLKNREEILCFLLAVLSWKNFINYYDRRKILNAIIGLFLIVLAYLAKETAVVFVAIIPLSLWFFRTKKAKNEKLKTKLIPSGNKKFIVTSLALQLFLLLIFTNPFDIINHPALKLSIFLLYCFISININRKSRGLKEIFNLRNIAISGFWLLFILALIFIPINGKVTSWLIFASMLSLGTASHLLRIRKKELNIPKIIINKKYLIIGVIALSAGIVVAIAYLIPEISLPEKNAPVYKWQNPLFSANEFNIKAGVIFYSLAYYLKLLIIPHPLRFYYGYAMIPEAGLTHPVVIVSIIIHAFLIYLMIKGLKNRRIWSFAIAFYFISIIPFSNIFFPVTGIIAERLLFIPSFGFSIIIAYLIFKLLNKNIYSFKNHKSSLIIAFSMIIVIPFSVLTIKRNSDWKNRETLYEADIPKLEQSAKANNLFANYLSSKVFLGMKNGVPFRKMDKTIKRSLKHYNLAIKADSTYANPYHNLGYAFMVIGNDYVKAEKYLNKCLKKDSTVEEAYLNRGIARSKLNKDKLAIKDFRKYINMPYSNEDFKAYYYMGEIFEKAGDTIKALELYDSSFNESQSQRKTLEKLKSIHAKKENYSKALLYNEKLIEISSPENDQVWVDKGNYHLLSGDTTNAINAWEKAFKIYPGNYEIGMTLSRYYAGEGDIKKAKAISRKAVLFRQKQNQKSR